MPASVSLVADTVWTSASPLPSGWYAEVNAVAYVAALDGVPEGGSAYHAKYPSGTNAGPAGHGVISSTATVPASGYREQYYAFSVCTSVGTEQDNSNMKILYPRKFGGGSQPYALTMIPHISPTSGQYTWRVAQQLSSNTNYNCNASGYTAASPYVCSDGTWYRVELWAKTNSTSGVANGAVRVWISAWTGTAWGVSELVIDVPTIDFGVSTWTEFYWDFYRGGSGNPTVSGDQYIYINRTMAAGVAA